MVLGQRLSITLENGLPRAGDPQINIYEDDEGSIPDIDDRDIRVNVRRLDGVDTEISDVDEDACSDVSNYRIDPDDLKLGIQPSAPIPVPVTERNSKLVQYNYDYGSNNNYNYNFNINYNYQNDPEYNKVTSEPEPNVGKTDATDGKFVEDMYHKPERIHELFKYDSSSHTQYSKYEQSAPQSSLQVSFAPLPKHSSKSNSHHRAHNIEQDYKQSDILFAADHHQCHHQEICENAKDNNPTYLYDIFSSPIHELKHTQKTPTQLREHESDKHNHRKKKNRLSAPVARIYTESGLIVHVGAEIGRGGYSRCYISQAESGHFYAVKIVTRKRSRHSKRAAMDEILIHRTLHHPYIVEFLEYLEKDSYTLMLLEYCSNNSLQEYVKERGKLTEREACYFLRPVSSAVEYLHHQFVHHGDIKLGNILLDEFMQPKLADFGFAKRLESQHHCRTRLCGTPAYMAPEIFIKPFEFGLPTDIWSIGVCAYTMLHGTPPFEAPSLNTLYWRIATHDLNMGLLDKGLSFAVFSFIENALAPDPRERPTIEVLCQSTWFRMGKFGELPGEASIRQGLTEIVSSDSEKPRLRYVVKNFIGRKLKIKKLHKSADNIAGL
ncbi:hypothetical protein DASB73_001160 [Starmerella bacillaris]|uniref:Protein kinase domain-containing protein n=1 Tax=Starmerella bacillaris TaxID=1247836 RepID=A0AAV5RCG6_STABA|nr:hypothetical protein DASB73_001160 [Starmerella bacillaris]